MDYMGADRIESNYNMLDQPQSGFSQVFKSQENMSALLYNTCKLKYNENNRLVVLTDLKLTMQLI